MKPVCAIFNRYGCLIKARLLGIAADGCSPDGGNPWHNKRTQSVVMGPGHVRAQAEHDQSSGPLQDGLNPDGKRRWLIWGSVAMGTFIATFDTSVVNVSLPTIAQTFGMTLVDIQWVELAYMLMVAIFLLPFGHLADLIGRRKVCVAGFGLFALGLFGAGLSTAIGGLLASRVLKAIGGAAFMANGPAIITETFLRDRGKAFGAITVVVSLGSILGPLCGGWLTQHWG